MSPQGDAKIESVNSVIKAFISLWLVLLGIFGIRYPAPISPSSISPPPLHFIVFGDSGTGDLAQGKLAAVMEHYPIDFILHTGDIAYPDGTEKELQDNFVNVYAPLLKKVPFYPAPGNHDYLTNDLDPYLNHFGKQRYYSFDKDNIHFISLDTNTPLFGEEMTQWLENDLENRKRAIWTVVFFHHPPFSSGQAHGSSFLVRQKIVPILEKHHVDLVFSGHEHNYERTKPINGIIYVVTGGGSGTLYEMGPIADFSAVHAVQTHFVYMTETKCSLDGKAINLKNETIDSFHLSRCKN